MIEVGMPPPHESTFDNKAPASDNKVPGFLALTFMSAILGGYLIYKKLQG